jgi:uncharacterized protein (TIGR03435 family)
VIDRTGLTERFDIHLEWEVSPLEPVSSETGGTSEAQTPRSSPDFRKQLGIELKPGKGPREYLGVDHLEQPSEK